jgi:hypothetical protein
MTLYHISEESDIEVFHPRRHPSHPNQPPLVWAIHEEKLPLYLFPRDCPRIAYFPTSTTTADDYNRFFSCTDARMIIAVEDRWFRKIMNTTLFCYHFPDEPFACFDEGAGYYVSPITVVPTAVTRIENLPEKLFAYNIELRITPSLFPLREKLISSTLHFSMIRMRNAR